MSEGVWIESECVWGGIDTKSVGKNVKSLASSDIAISSSDLSYLKTPMSGGCLDAVCQKVLYFRVSVGCLNGVWKVS